MAEVLLARATGIEGFERHVVLKRIRDEQARDARFVQMFLEEARLAASLHHTNIVQVHDIGQDDGEYFFAMEYVHGEDLRKLLMHVAERDQTVPLEHVITIIAAAAAALHHAHEAKSTDRKHLGLVHRDVSPANILVGYDGNVKVVDFGIARATQRTTETQSGLMKGKVAYMSPEQCVGLGVDRRSDIFCLGIVLYELVTVRRLFKGANDFLTMSSITHGVIPRPSEFRPIAPQLEAIILKALAQKPEDRYQTADQMRSALEAFAATAGLRLGTSALAEYMRAQFGDPPMPWLADDDETECELTYDFDGSASGVVSAPHGFDMPSQFVDNSPIHRARTKAITDAPPLSEQSGGLPPMALTRTSETQSVPPMPSSPQVAHRNRRYAIIGGAAGGLILLAIVLTVALRGGDAASEAGVQPPEMAIEPPAVEKAVKHDEPVTPPNLMPAADEPKPKPAPAVTKTVVKPPKPAPPTKKPAHGAWDPNSLFPKSK
jgi:serine/threonine protein kinase